MTIRYKINFIVFFKNILIDLNFSIILYNKHNNIKFNIENNIGLELILIYQ